MLILKSVSPFIIVMALVIIASNYLVQFPVKLTIGHYNLADILTWGAFTYPIAFLITDMTNRKFGPSHARIVIIIGFIIAVGLSIQLANPRIAIASGMAFLLAQMLDVSIFNFLRQSSWWHAPLASTIIGSVFDSILFFSIAFSASFQYLGFEDLFALETISLPGLFLAEIPRWVFWAIGDLGVKLGVGFFMLLPYRATLSLPYLNGKHPI